MAIIPSLFAAIKSALGGVVPRLRFSTLRVLTRIGSFGYRRRGHTVTDIVETVTSGQPESVANVLGQSVFTTTRMLDTYASVLGSDDKKLLPRNLIVSARLKTARNYQVIFTADISDSKGVFQERRFFSFYTDTQKAFSEWGPEFIERLQTQGYEVMFTFDNLEIQHLLHRRGAPWLPVPPRE